MKKITFILFLLLFLTIATHASASTNETEVSATLDTPEATIAVDKRPVILEHFLTMQNSPLAPFAKDMIKAADANRLDWKLVPAIAGVESTFGNAIPTESYNAWGFGIYGNNVRRFTSWTDGIETVSSALRTDYIMKWNAHSVGEIGALYAADPGWAYKVVHYMDALEAFQKEKETTMLSISL